MLQLEYVRFYGSYSQTHKVEVEYIVAVQGLKRTIACMDEEHPRTEASINNRSHLRQILNMEDLYRKNKVGHVDTCRLWWKWTTKIMCVADFSVIAGSELPPKNSTGDHCKWSHEFSRWQSQQQYNRSSPFCSHYQLQCKFSGRETKWDKGHKDRWFKVWRQVFFVCIYLSWLFKNVFLFFYL